ncbi:DUF3128 family, human c22orf39 ortholog, implicated in gene expression [Schizosaccharomyces pombe]|uniref:Uncharacterized protein C227.17c n=1 Tax=Schizosaccharomyces pombe (strain 972 / ATCC 24843) TaxID=284812 RepID=YIDH_SCHPO|nr:uncharacterized protein SPAC227.17c [Schizosaccharomyces pombe]Q9UTC2.1 RecName: Full=Uncharacterized protein C227.17c [Schizosaccharomyces pombe 972h-]CAB61466.1 conserved protein [Schizosaccharomyces pombe]|eukprot:NP_592971.1 uncharacterized protein SPAC227.17c [Schizosaccharomyces pombe]
MNNFKENDEKSTFGQYAELDKILDLKKGIPEDPCSLQYYFDQMAMCLTVFSQMNHYYRYGEYNRCKGNFKDFKWCLSTKSKAHEEAQEGLRKRRLQQWMKFRQGPNSEDIWKMRTSPKSSE